MKRSPQARSLVTLTTGLLLIVAALPACGDDEDTLPPAGVACASLDPTPAIVTDIDETLTLSDMEFLQQVIQPEYVPRMRTDALALIQELYRRGYHVVYLTARSEDLELVDGTMAREATVSWLTDQGFPMNAERTRVDLSPVSHTGDDAGTAAYKRDTIEAYQTQGWEFVYAFGNATTDASAYVEAGIPLAQIYMIGELAGDQGTVAVAGEGWTDVLATEITPLPRICDF
jgi:phosphatidate phosphatase PAH1